jgi:hypothetical protein
MILYIPLGAEHIEKYFKYDDYYDGYTTREVCYTKVKKV